MMGMAVGSLYLPSEGAVKGQPKRRWPWRQHCHLCLHLSIPGGRAGPTVEESGSRPILSDPTTARDQALPGRLMGRGGKLPSPHSLGAQLCTAGSFRQELGPQAAPLLCTAAFPARVPLLGGLPHAGASAEALFSILTQYTFTSSPSSSHTPMPSPVHKRAGALPRAPGQRFPPSSPCQGWRTCPSPSAVQWAERGLGSGAGSCLLPALRLKVNQGSLWLSARFAVLRDHLDTCPAPVPCRLPSETFCQHPL